MAIDPITTGIGAGLTAVAGIGQMIGGGIQAKRGRKDLAEIEANRVDYTRPEEVDEAGRIVRLRASNPFLPGQNLMEQNVMGATADTVNNIQDMGGVSDLYMAQRNQNAAMNDIGIQSAANNMKNEMTLLNQLTTEADYTDKEFDYNVNIPYQEKRQDALSRIGAGMQNLFGGLNTIASGATGFMGMQGKEGFADAPTADGGVSNQVGANTSIDVNPVGQMNSLFAPQNRLSTIRQNEGYMNPIGINFPSKPAFPNRIDRINNLYNF